MLKSVRLLVIIALVSGSVFAGSVPGIKNFDRVDDHVYRGAQPTDDAFHYLAKIGIRTVVDLQEADSRGQAEQKMVTAEGMNYVNVPMTGLTPPTEAEITKLLDILENSSTGPIFVHCHRGADRTGAVIAAYHIDHDKWDSGRALSDAEAHSMSVFQFPRKTFIRTFSPRTIQTENPSRPPAVVSSGVATLIPLQN
jgi:protein tyrosine phosphatase (PTP) superfamily phosphohydrolase (DUF442 family)